MFTRSMVILTIAGFSGMLASGAEAQVPPLECSTAFTAAPGEVSIYNLPDGQGWPLSRTMAFGNPSPIDATITFHLCDPVTRLPVVGYPAEDIWLETSSGGLTHCQGGTIADHPTNALGVTTFSGELAAGRQSNRLAAEKILVSVSGIPVGGSPLSVSCNSPDIDGDLRVDLRDTVLFVTNAMGAYHYRSDFFFDGVLNLSDVVLFSRGLGASCP